MYYVKNLVKQAERDMDAIETVFKKRFGQDWFEMLYVCYDSAIALERRELHRARVHKSADRNIFIQV